MTIVIGVLIMITCILLVLIILVQNSKGGGLASNFSASNQVMGVRKTADFLEKSTWTLAIALFAFSLLAAAINSGSKNVATVQESEIKEQVDNMAPIAPPSNFGQQNIPPSPYQQKEK